MNTRKLRGAVGRRSVLLVALAVLFATAGVLYAHWSDTLTVEAQVNTGFIAPVWSVHGTNDDGGPNGWDDEYSEPWEWDNGNGSSADPSGPQGWGRYSKNVARCDAEFFDQGQNQSGLSIWVDNAYPSYWCTILADLGNDGTVPVKLQGINWTVELDTGDGPFQVDGINPVDPAQIIEEGGYDLDPEFFPPETAWFIMEGADTPAHDLDIIFDNLEFASCGYQLDPGMNPEFYIHVHPFQGAVQGANYRINADFEWVNYNEYRPENAYGCAGEGGGYEPIDPPSDKTKGFAVRYKSMNQTQDWDVYLGVGDVGQGIRSQARWPGNPVTWPTPVDAWFAFNPDADEIYTHMEAGLSGDDPDIALTFPDLVTNPTHPYVTWDGCPAGEYQFMEIFVRDENVSFNGVHLNGQYLGDFAGTQVLAWTGDFAGGFDLNGVIEHGPLTSSSSELYKVEVLVGCAPEV